MIYKSNLSLGQSALTIKDIVKNAKDMGYKSVCLADNNLYGVVTFVYAARKEGLLPIIGLTKEINDVEYLLIAWDNKGLQELMKGETKGFTSPNLENVTSIALNVNSTDAKIESQYYSTLEANNEVSKYILESSNLINIDISIANIVSEEDKYKKNAINSIVNSKPFYKNWETMNFSKPSKKEDLVKLQEFINIVKLAKDDFDFGNPNPPKFKFTEDVSKEYNCKPTDEDLFRVLSEKGLQERFGNKEIPIEYKERLQREIDIINNMKFPGYMLIIWDFINFAKSQNIPVGPGRGSAAGSLVAWALFITNIDPIPYGLLFERFLNPERVSLPDIDMDFCNERRHEVIDYVIEKYGDDNVAQAITFGTTGGKSALKDAARTLQYPIFIGEKLADKIDDNIKNNIETLTEFAADDLMMKETLNLAFSIEGFYRNTGVHAAAVVISNDPVYTKSAVYKSKDGSNVTGVDGKYLEDVDLIKYDFLGLKNLTVIENTVKAINYKGNIWDLPLDDKEVLNYIQKGNNIGLFQIESAGMQDLARRLKPSSFEDIIAMLALYRPGPMESGMLDDFIDRKHGRAEIDYFHDEFEEALKPILEPTYGVIVYQEQVMKIVQEIGGFSLGGADLVRRAMGKKIKEEMDKLKTEFADGGESKGFTRKYCEELFDLIVKFAGYGFNKSHSAAYAMITYITAYLKLYYPVEFMTASLNNVIDNPDNRSKFLNETKRLGIEIVNPSITTSSSMFSSKDQKIFFGLKGIKEVGSMGDVFTDLDLTKDFKDIIKDCQKDPKKEFDSLTKKVSQIERKINSNSNHLIKIDEKISKREAKDKLSIVQEKAQEKDLLEKSRRYHENIDLQTELEVITEELKNINPNEENHKKINKSAFIALAEIGAFDSFNISRKVLVDNFKEILDPKRIDSIDLFIKDEYSKSEIMTFEMDRVGTLLTDLFTKEERNELCKYEVIEDRPIGIIINKEERKTKKGKVYHIISLLDLDGNIHNSSDFNGKSNNFNLGDKIMMQIQIKGNFSNILKLQKLNKKVLDSLPIRESNITIQVFQDISTVDLNAHIIEIKDFNNKTIATFIK